MQSEPQTKKKRFGLLTTNLLDPARIFIAVMIVAVIFFIPAVSPGDEQRGSFVETYPALNPMPSSADACPWGCIQCTEWDPDSWPLNCLTYECLDESGNCGDPDDGGGGGPSYQPPAISHILNCSRSGNNGWCIGALSLDLSASDPQGQSVILSGDVNGGGFTCVTNPCSIALPEGMGTANYKVDSATGLSVSGSASFQLDVTTPQIGGNVSGSIGTNNWYTSQALVSASASDSLSGIASFEVSVDGAPFTNYQSPISFSDGIHTIQYRAYDNAGNITETLVQEIKVDTVAPTLNVVATGTTGNNNWYISNVTLTPTASDSMSGLAALEATTDGVTWFSVNAPVVFSDGIYTVQFRATDQAGNISRTAAQQIKVDATTPGLNLKIAGARGQNDWYVSQASVAPNASDNGSGIAAVEAAIDNGTWKAVIDNQLPVFTDGVHSYQIKVTDNAGNVTTTPALPLMVDTVPPAIAIYDDTLDLGDILYYDLEDSLSGLWINRTVIEDDAEKYKKIVWVEELTGAKANDNEIRWDGVFSDGTKAAPGEYFITLKISDQAGNETMRTVIVQVTALNALLPIPAFTPPASDQQTSEVSETSEVAPASTTFGGTANDVPAGQESMTVTEGEASPFAGVTVQTGFSTGNQTAALPISNPNVLWGAAAAALLGSTLAEWQRRREEEAARPAASRGGGGDSSEEEGGTSNRKNPGRVAYEAKMRQKRIVGESQALLNQKVANEKAYEAYRAGERVSVPVNPQTQSAREKLIAKNEDRAPIDEARVAQLVRNNVYAARWEGVVAVEQAKQDSEKKSGNWLSNLWNAGMSAVGTILSPLKNAYSNNSDDPTIGETLVPRPSRWTIYYLPEQAAMRTYLASSINVQSEGANVKEEDRNSHLGPAQLSRNELDTPYKQGFDDNGEFCNKNCRGYGLGLPGEDPFDNKTAVRGMDRRIQQVIDRAEKLSEDNNIALTTTDKYIIAAMAQNGPGFDFNDINRVINPGDEGFIKDGAIDWEAYFETKQTEWENRVGDALKNPFDQANAETIVNNMRTWGADYDTQFMLEKFYEETSALQREGYYLPNDLDITRIEGLINQSAGTGGGQ